MIKRLFFLSFMMGAIGVPYLMTSSAGWLNDIKARFRSDGKTPAAPAEAPAAPAVSHGQPSSAAAGLASFAARPQQINELPAHDLAEVLHFNGTPAWVMSQWPRVTSGLSQPNLQGYRVPLVSGTAENDVAGSLTYYFDSQQHVKFITLRGTTGDPRKLIALVTQRYSLKPQPSHEPGVTLYQVRWNGKPLSELRVRPASVVRADQPNARYEVELALMKP